MTIRSGQKSAETAQTATGIRLLRRRRAQPMRKKLLAWGLAGPRLLRGPGIRRRTLKSGPALHATRHSHGQKSAGGTFGRGGRTNVHILRQWRSTRGICMSAAVQQISTPQFGNITGVPGRKSEVATSTFLTGTTGKTTNTFCPWRHTREIYMLVLVLRQTTLTGGNTAAAHGRKGAEPRRLVRL